MQHLYRIKTYLDGMVRFKQYSTVHQFGLNLVNLDSNYTVGLERSVTVRVLYCWRFVGTVFCMLYLSLGEDGSPRGWTSCEPEAGGILMDGRYRYSKLKY
jgi:hypothetical protein